MRTNKSLYWFFLTLILLTACTVTRFRPISGSSVAVEDNYAIMRTDSLLIAVRPQLFQSPGSSFAERYFSLFIQIRNISNKPVIIPQHSFSIISSGLQYDYIPLENVLNNYRLNLMINNDDFLTEPVKDPWSIETSTSEIDYATDLMNNYLSFGSLVPGSRKEGYLFYNNRLDKSAQFEIITPIGNVVYIRSK